MEKLKSFMPVLLALNLCFTLMLFFTSGGEDRTIIINSKHKENRSELKELVCRGAFKEIKEKKYSNFYLHPEVVNGIKNDSSKDYELSSSDKFYFSFVTRQICKVVVKKQSGFVAFEAIISESGPLSYQVTSLRPMKPSYKDVKEYL